MDDGTIFDFMSGLYLFGIAGVVVIGTVCLFAAWRNRTRQARVNEEYRLYREGKYRAE